MKLAVFSCFAACGVLHAQQYMISTYVGGPLATVPVTAVNAAIGSPQGIATDATGNVYFTSLNANSPAYYHGRYGVFKLDPNGVLTRIAGNSGEGYSGDGGRALDAQFRFSNYDDEPGLPGIAVDAAGNVYIADSGNNRVRMVTPLGIISTVAGNGMSGNSSDGWPATSKQLDYPSGLSSDGGSLYIAASDRVRRVSPTERNDHHRGHGGRRQCDRRRLARQFVHCGRRVGYRSLAKRGRHDTRQRGRARDCRGSSSQPLPCGRWTGSQDHSGWRCDHGRGQRLVRRFGRWRPSRQRAALRQWRCR